ncbi:MAG: lycopene cyclase domain-containing protein [Flavobacteriales bacterium]|nr:lycopene cyclase domain-containing protein [Flavobacteriales bacterium]
MAILESKYLYAALMVFSLAYPLAQSFEWRLKYYRSWPGLFRGIGIMAILFIPWDIYFTEAGVWWFNDDYISGLKIAGLPIEEWLFFLVVPLACVFIHEVQKYYLRHEIPKQYAAWFSILLSGFLLTLSIVYSDRAYTSLTFSLTSLGLILLAYFQPPWIGRFYITYFICWLPFLLINGALTGNFTKAAVVNYNPDEFMGIRIGTIPVEDSIYNLLLLLIVVWIFENWQRKRGISVLKDPQNQ